MMSEKKGAQLVAFAAGIAAKFDAPPIPLDAPEATVAEWLLALARSVHARLEAANPVPSAACRNRHTVYASRDHAGEWWVPQRCPVCGIGVDAPAAEKPSADAAMWACVHCSKQYPEGALPSQCCGTSAFYPMPRVLA